MRPGHSLGAALVVIAALAAGRAADAQEWPTRSILVISPFNAGTMNDIVAHDILDPVGSQIGQSVLLENRPGGAGTVGVSAVVKAQPDGYTLLLSTWALSAAVILHKSLPYDTLQDLAPVAMFGGEPCMLMASPGKGYNTVADLVSAAKANPGKIKFASVGIGSASHIAGERFRVLAQVDVLHVPYPGPGEALTDLTAGRVDFYFVPVTPALPLISEGRAVPLAVSTPQRLQSLPGLPTLAESGYSSLNFLTWFGLSAPAKTPRDIIDKLNAAVGKSLNLPAVRTKLLRIGVVPLPMSPEQFTTFFTDDVAAMIKLGQDAHIAPLN